MIIHLYLEFLSQLYFWMFFAGVNVTFFPMYFLGLAGTLRRIPDYLDFFAVWNKLASFSSNISILSAILFFVIVYITFTTNEEK